MRISGPRVLENGRQQYVDLTCSFRFQAAEYKQLDIKWYFDNEVGLTTDYWLEQDYHYWNCVGGAIPPVGPQRWQTAANNRTQI